MRGNHPIVITDLDGTLLDKATYSFEAALPAIRTLKKRNIPLVFCSSKTRAEIEVLRRSIGNQDPFVSENGGAVIIPRSTFDFEIADAKEQGDVLALELGLPYGILRSFLAGIQAERPGQIRGFGDMSNEEVAALCGFSLEQARLARRREFDEPFLCDDPDTRALLRQRAAKSGLRVVQGGRFHHLIGPNDKGLAVRRLRELYLRDRGSVSVIGLGDSLNDLPLLQEADIPVLVPGSDGTCEPSIDLPGIIRARLPGPAGWRDTVLDLIGIRDSVRF